MVIKRIGVLSVAKMYGAIMVTVGLLAGLVVAAVGSVSSAFSSGSHGLLPFAGIGIAAIIVLPILYGIIGFVCGAIGALYNLFAAIVGGIEIETS